MQNDQWKWKMATKITAATVCMLKLDLNCAHE